MLNQIEGASVRPLQVLQQQQYGAVIAVTDGTKELYQVVEGPLADLVALR